MNIIKIFFANLIAGIRRNPLTFLVVLLLMLAAPWLFGVIALVFVVMALVALFSWLSIIWRVRDAQRQMERDFDEAGGNRQRNYRRSGTKEGDVTVVATEPSRKRVNDDVGEYVDFKEVEESSEKGTTD
jgi:hypothetical protein